MKKIRHCHYPIIFSILALHNCETPTAHISRRLRYIHWHDFNFTQNVRFSAVKAIRPRLLCVLCKQAEYIDFILIQCSRKYTHAYRFCLLSAHERHELAVLGRYISFIYFLSAFFLMKKYIFFFSFEAFSLPSG